MAKGQLRGNKEAKKPKSDRPKGRVSAYEQSLVKSGQEMALPKNKTSPDKLKAGIPNSPTQLQRCPAEICSVGSQGRDAKSNDSEGSQVRLEMGELRR